jgi:hypothetical protein
MSGYGLVARRRQREYYLKNSEHIKQRSRGYFEYYWNTKYGKMVRKATGVNSGAVRRGMKGKVSAADILSLNMPLPCCSYPGCTESEYLEYDHILGAVMGGENLIANICLLCKPHHREKTNAEHRYRSCLQPFPKWICDLQGREPEPPSQLDMFLS